VSILRASSRLSRRQETAEARQRISQLEEWFAEKDYLTGVHYGARPPFVDPAIITLDVVVRTPRRRDRAQTASSTRRSAGRTMRRGRTPPWKAYPGDPRAARRGDPKAEKAVATPSTAPKDTVATPVAYARPGPR
jgi:outer membrane protein assembly factor BamD